MASTGVTVNQLIGVLTDTIAHYKDVDVLNVAQTYQKLVFMDEVMKQRRYDVQGGDRIEYRIVTDDKGNARHANYLEARTVEMRNPVVAGNAPWTLADAEVNWNRWDLSMNKGASKVHDYVKTEYFRAKMGLLKLIEERAPLAPDSSTDTKNPRGMGYWFGWLPSGTTDYTGGFNGTTAWYGDGTTTTAIGGIERTTNPLCCNYAVNHDGINPQTLNSLLTLLTKIDFYTPKDAQQYVSNRAKLTFIMSSLDNQIAYQILRNQISNGTRNGDLSPFAGMDVEYHGVRWHGLATLNSVPYNPIYVGDFSYFYPIVHSVMWLKEVEVMRHPDQRHIFRMGVDCWYGYMCDNPRRIGVMHNVR